MAARHAPTGLVCSVLLGVPGTNAMVLAELARLEATLEVLATTPPPKLLPYGDNARLG